MIGNVKHGNFDRLLGILYMVAQVGGAVAGGLLANVLSTNDEVDASTINPGN